VNASSDGSGITKHRAYLDGLRALCALWVVAHHCWSQVHLHGVAAIVLRPFAEGTYAVAMFIALSGFCLMMPVVKSGGELRGGAFEFLKRRAWRILPPYYFSIAFSLLLIWLLVGKKTGTHWDFSVPVTLHSIWTHLFLVHDAFKQDAGLINHVYWSIAVEWRIYFFFPLLVLGWKWIGPLKTTLAGILLSYLLLLASVHWIDNTLIWQCLGIFAMGMLAAGISYSDEPGFRLLRNLRWGWIFLFLAFIVFVPLHLPLMNTRFQSYVGGLCTVSVLLVASCNPGGWFHRLLSWKPLVFIGSFAYSIYLVHAPLVQVLWQYPLAPLQSHPVLMFCALLFPGVPLMLGVAYLFYLGCELPFIPRRRNVAPKSVLVAGMPDLA
jgi:peptidoglycan/LPS O-acetylase OafA/YrhL